MTPFKTHDLLAAPHGFFSRRGGISTGTYDSLNAGMGSSDDAANVTENRARIAAAIGAAPDRLLSCHQIHSNTAVIATAPWTQNPQADAIVTNTPGIAISALGADCAPVLFCDTKNGVIGAAHAGWRGAQSGITDSAINAMESLGASRERICAVIGPCISAQNYEVGPDFRAAFDASEAKFFAPGPNDRLHFDLKSYLLSRLRAAGLHNIAALPDCTYAAPQTYFSYRYNTHYKIADYGRNISAIMLRPE